MQGIIFENIQSARIRVKNVANAAGERKIIGEEGEPATLGEAAYQRLRADIVAGELEAGKPLRLEALRQRGTLSP